MRIAIIGAGVSGIGTAHILQKNGHEVTIFEKSSEPGGVWAVAYPEVRLQNSSPQYHFSDFPWPFEHDLHPTASQIQRYLKEAIQHFQLEVKLEHEVLDLREYSEGWVVTYRHQSEETRAFFDYAIIAIGQYTEGKYRPYFEGEEKYKGSIVTEREIKDLEEFNDKEVAVVGFGKSALDMAAFAAPRAKQVHHIFRTPRWLVPLKVFGVHYSYPFFCRMGSFMVPSWVYPTALERAFHKRCKFFVNGFWNLISRIFKLNIKKHQSNQDSNAKERLKAVEPKHDIKGDLRSAVALAPSNYYQAVSSSEILPYHATVESFTTEGIKLSGGQEVKSDIVVLSLGSKSPTFPFLSKKYRNILEKEEDGIQLYRHLIHPEIPKLGFAGFNHGFMHIPAVEVGAVWLCAYFSNELQLPKRGEMLQEIDKITDWKRAHINFEPSRNCATNIRFQQYLDILLKDLGISPYRKLPNVFAEAFVRYGASDYKGVSELYHAKKEKQKKALQLVLADS